jgi:hypothetical protein
MDEIASFGIVAVATIAAAAARRRPIVSLLTRKNTSSDAAGGCGVAVHVIQCRGENRKGEKSLFDVVSQCILVRYRKLAMARNSEDRAS